MATVDELLERCPGLSRSTAFHLHRLIRGWAHLADIAFADLLLYVPHPDAGAEADLVIAAHVRPTTSRSIHRTELIGRHVAHGERPLVDLALVEGVMVDGGLILQPNAARIRTLAVPVRFHDEVVAVVSREFNPDVQREPGELEMNYFVLFRRLARMISEGTYPFPVDDIEVEEAPRVSDGLVILDASARVQFISPNAASSLHRMGVEVEVEGRRLVEVGLEQRAIRSAFSSRLPQFDEVVRPDGRTLILRCLPLLEGGEVTGGLAMVRDISELRRRDRLLVSKDATIAEIHHRVKNNLQTISSLLRVQGRRLVAPEARQAIEESVRRIRSIAIVHEILSREVAAEVPFIEIVRPLVRLVEEGLTAQGRVEFRIEGVVGELPTALATPLAVVLTELLQNALEHAFEPVVGTGEVVICFENDGVRLRVQVTDDGSGLPEGFSLDDTKSLGLTIVRSLVEGDLGGTISIRRGQAADRPGRAPAAVERPGTVVELSVPLVRGWDDTDAHLLVADRSA